MRDNSLKPIEIDNDGLAAALEHAHAPALLASLVHLSGDTTLLDGLELETSLFGDPQAGISEADQARIRERALTELAAWRDAGCPELAVLPDAAVAKIMNLMVGQELPGEYVEFLRQELSMRGEDPYAQPALEAVPADKRAGFSVLIIGAGMSGLLSAIRLQEAGIDYVIVDKNDDVGGTWHENTYPGCRVDSPNHTYSYSFEPNDWPQHFSDQPTLRAYFRGVADKYGLRDQVRLNTTVTELRFDEAAGEWQADVEGPDGAQTLQANAVISCVGQLNRPKWPDIPGQDRYQGPAFHSAEWDHDVDLTGKRVGVIGTGASAFQFVPRIVDAAEHVTVFQRTPPWCSPTPEYHEYIPEGKHYLLNHVPFYAKWFRFYMFWMTAEGLLDAVSVQPGWNDSGRSVSPDNQALREMLTAYAQETLVDRPDLLKVSVPDYPPGAKRMLRDDGTWLRTLARADVTLVTDAITEINEGGLADDSGQQHDVDVLIYGTGFRASDFLFPMRVFGRDGRELQEVWDGDARAYKGITIPGFPNLFCCYGPNTNIVVNGSIIFFSECEVRYVLGCLALLMDTGAKAMDCRLDVHDAYNADIDAGNARMAWGASDVNTWYRNDAGRISQNWPFTLREYWQATRSVDPEDYVLS